MKKLTKKIFRTFGTEITRYIPNPNEKVISLKSEGNSKGDVLFSYMLSPFLLKPGEAIPNSHNSHWRCLQIAQTFFELGYSVDVIDSHNMIFRPEKQYAVFVGHRINFDYIVGLLDARCVKVAHLDTAHWIFNNHATYQRKYELQQRRGMTILGSHRIVEPNLAIESADYGSICANDFTLNTFRHSNKPICKLPQSPSSIYAWPEDKNFQVSRNHFLWLGSHGFVHKGLDLVLEAFAEMPDVHLYVCAPLQKEKEFVKSFDRELYRTANIHAIGWVDVDSPEFIEIANKCVGVVYASCSEGGGASVITCMHGGMIPIVNYESSVDVEDFGVLLKDSSINSIKLAIQMVSTLPVEQLKQMAHRAWKYARANHTREQFSKEYEKFALDILKMT